MPQLPMFPSLRVGFAANFHLQVEFQYVKGHSNEPGNDAADSLANQGCLLPVVAEPDWAALEQETLENMEYWDAEEFDDELIASIEEPQIPPPPAASSSSSTTFAVAAARGRTVTPPAPAPMPDRPSQSAAGPDASLRETAVQTLQWKHAPGCVPPDPSLRPAPASAGSTAAAGSGLGQSSRAGPPRPQQRAEPEPELRQEAAAPVLTQAELDVRRSPPFFVYFV